MSKPFTIKRIRIEIALKAGKFDDGNDVLIIDDLPMHVEIVKAGIPSFPEASITIWGLSLNKMKALSMVGHVALQRYRNRVKIYAGDNEDRTKLPLIFVGDESFGAMQVDESGNARFEMKAFTGIYASLEPAKPQSVVGQVKVEELIAQFAKEAGFESFENQGVTASVTDCIIQGDNITKMRTLAEAVGAGLIIDDKSVILLPKTKARNSVNVTLNRFNGLLGYPSINSYGIQVTSVFRPDIVFGQIVHVDSVIPLATGDHKVIKLVHTLDANQNDGGAWHTMFESYFNYSL